MGIINTIISWRGKNKRNAMVDKYVWDKMEKESGGPISDSPMQMTKFEKRRRDLVEKITKKNKNLLE